VLIGAEFNAHIFPKPPVARPQTETPEMVTAGHADRS